MFNKEIVVPVFRIKTWILTLLLVVLLGALIFSVYGSPIASVRSAPAHAGTAWEYKISDVISMSDPTNTQKLNELGLEGWELTGYIGSFGIFKRPLK